MDRHGAWPQASLDRCRQGGVPAWFVGGDYGGRGASQRDILDGYMGLAEACLTTAFVWTQHAAAVKRFALADESLRARLLPPLARGERHATVGISHLTTSRRHLGKPVLQATRTGDGYRLDGVAPWVTGADHADWLLIAATCEDARELLLAVPTPWGAEAEAAEAETSGSTGIVAKPPVELVALTGSRTGAVEFEGLEVAPSLVVAGPEEGVLSGGSRGATGGLETSALALGLASASLGFLSQQAELRPDLAAARNSLADEHARLREGLLELADQADGKPAPSTQRPTKAEVRTGANSLTLRAAQAALAAAKGAGFVQGHPAGRWCREALFFLVWSCPQPVLHANLCELAGVELGE